MAERIEQIIVPIVAGRRTTTPMALRLLGTAFFVGNARTFLTAWHVMEGAEEAKRKGEEVFILVNDGGRLRPFLIVDVRRPHPQADIAVGCVDQDVASPLSLFGGRISFGRNVCCIGYPLHLFRESPDRRQYSAPLRFMKGHIHSDVWADHDLLQATHPVDYYELSFPIPRGVSGSPVMLEGTNTVIGVCIGTAKGMQFDSIQEREEGRTTEIYDVERIGIAHMSSVVADVTFPWLNGKALKQLSSSSPAALHMTLPSLVCCHSSITVLLKNAQ